jgi:hypothetical protein
LGAGAIDGGVGCGENAMICIAATDININEHGSMQIAIACVASLNSGVEIPICGALRPTRGGKAPILSGSDRTLKVSLSEVTVHISVSDKV